MSMQVKPGYVNPLTMMKDHGAGLGGLKKAGKVEEGMKDKVKELQKEYHFTYTIEWK